jgi:hypothetical protein
MKYTIKHGRIAALQYVITPEGKEIRIVHTNEFQPEFEALPEAVRAAVNRQFGIVFSLPYSSRESFVQSSLPFEVTA